VGVHEMAIATSVDQLLERGVESGVAAGVVAVAADRSGVIYEGAFGKRAIDGQAPMTLDTVFWIASMTKAITSVAALQLVEQGQVGLDEPIADKLPELKDIQVLEGCYDIWNADMGRYQEHTGTPGIIECKKLTLMNPLVFDPGDRWEYGTNIDWVGQTVERITGTRIEQYFKDHIFGPLGMRDSGFVLGTSQRERLAGMHVRTEDRTLQAIPFEMDQDPEFFMGGGGLYSSGPDYVRFLRMLINNGELDGARILKPETVAECNRNQIGELNVGMLKTVIPGSSNDAEFFPGAPKKWGLAYMINAEDAPVGRSAGSLAWAGLANTYYWIETKRQIAGVLLTQILPFADARVLGLLDEFERGIYAAVG
jgi:methyl acetate hydrolase